MAVKVVMAANKTILHWTSKVQYKKGTPYIALLKSLSQNLSLCKGNEITCELVLINGKLKVIINLE